MGIKKQATFFLISGGIATLIDIFIFNLFYLFTSIFILSRISGILISMIFNFTFNKKITFNSKNKTLLRITGFIFLYFTTMYLNTLTGVLIIKQFGNQTIIANFGVILGILVSTPLNFLGLKYIIFKEKILK